MRTGVEVVIPVRAPVAELKLTELVPVKVPVPEIVPDPLAVIVSAVPLEMFVVPKAIGLLPTFVIKERAPVEINEVPVTVKLAVAAWLVTDNELKLEDDERLKFPTVLTMVAAPPGLLNERTGVAVCILPTVPELLLSVSEVVAVSVKPPV